MESNEFIESGFAFSTKEEAESAKKEAQGVKYIKQKIDYDNPMKALKIYHKLIKEELFSTPIGYAFLNDFREYLLSQPSIKKELVPPIKIKKQVVVKEVIEHGENKAIIINSKKKEKDYRKISKNLTIFSTVLVIVIIAMFIISTTSDNVNILNYKNKIINQYEQWNQELTEREQIVKENEKKI